MSKQFLFIGDLSDQHWIELLESASKEYGNLTVVSLSDLGKVIWAKIRIVFLDALNVGEISKTIISLRKYNKKMHVVVVTYSPTWERILEAKNAGASAYIQKFITKRDLSEKIGEILRSPTPAIQTVPLPEKTLRCKQKRILLADNYPAFLHIRAELLKEEGYHVIKAISLFEAQSVLEKGNVDLAILDLRLVNDENEDDFSGLELAKKAAPLLPKIIMSNFGTKHNKIQEFKSGLEMLPSAVDFIDKGSGIDALLLAIRQALSHGSDIASR